MNQIVTIDGPAGSGKSTVSRLLAKKLGFLYLDTGAMYRAAALYAGRKGIDLDDNRALNEMCREMDIKFALNGDNLSVYLGEEDISLEIRKPEMDMFSSRISMIKEVRDAMTGLQRKIGREGRLVAEGRDMGTVVFPDADYKFFINASVEVRAKRRYSERIDRGEAVSMEEVETELRKRDEQDKNRQIAPLMPAKNAIIIDTTPLGIDQVIEKILDSMGEGEVRIL